MGTIELNQWQRAENDFATRVDVDELEGFFRKGLVVEEGTKALLFIDGKYAGELEPGRHDIDGIKIKLRNFDLRRRASALLVDASDCTIGNVTLNKLRTKDKLNVSVECTLTVKLSNPAYFFTNKMKGKRGFSILDLRSSIYGELKEALGEAIADRPIDALSTTAQLKRDIEMEIKSHLNEHFSRDGLEIIQLTTFLVKQERYESLEDKLGELTLDAKELNIFKQKASLWKEVKEAVNSAKMDDIKSEEDFANFLHEIDKGKLIREEEFNDLVQTYRETREDRSIQRRFLLAKLDAEQKMELKRLELERQMELKKIELTEQGKLNMQEFDLDLEKQRKKLDLEFETERRQFDEKIRKGKAGIELLEITKEVKNKEADKELERNEKAKEAEFHRQQEELKLKSQNKIAEIETYKGLSVEQIIAINPNITPEAAEVLKANAGAGKVNANQLIEIITKLKDEHIKDMKELQDKAIEAMKQVATAKSESTTPPPPPPINVIK
jgi:hypothetical protein